MSLTETEIKEHERLEAEAEAADAMEMPSRGRHQSFLLQRLLQHAEDANVDFQALAENYNKKDKREKEAAAMMVEETHEEELKENDLNERGADIGSDADFAALDELEKEEEAQNAARSLLTLQKGFAIQLETFVQKVFTPLTNWDQAASLLPQLSNKDAIQAFLNEMVEQHHSILTRIQEWDSHRSKIVNSHSFDTADAKCPKCGEKSTFVISDSKYICGSCGENVAVHSDDALQENLERLDHERLNLAQSVLQTLANESNQALTKTLSNYIGEIKSAVSALLKNNSATEFLRSISPILTSPDQEEDTVSSALLDESIPSLPLFSLHDYVLLPAYYTRKLVVYAKEMMHNMQPNDSGTLEAISKLEATAASLSA